jgi:transposase
LSKPIPATAEIASYRARAEKAGRNAVRVIAIYEARWSGFWLVRWLAKYGIETHVIQPSSVPVDRRARRAKSDGIDADLLLRTLLAWLRGEPRVCSMVPIPAETDEDARRRVRERAELVAERIGLVNRIGAVLATLGARFTQIVFSPGFGWLELTECNRNIGTWSPQSS